MSLIENLILIKKAIAEKSKIRYHIRKLEGRNKQLIPIDEQKKRGRPLKEKIIKEPKTRGRKPNNNITIDNLPKYLLIKSHQLSE